MGRMLLRKSQDSTAEPPREGQHTVKHDTFYGADALAEKSRLYRRATQRGPAHRKTRYILWGGCSCSHLGEA